MDRGVGLAIVAFLVGLPSLGFAQDHPRRSGPVYTLDWLAAQADVVVIAEFSEPNAAQDGQWNRARWHRVRARAVETLKGEVFGDFEFAVDAHPDKLKFGIRFHQDVVDGFRGHQVLVFLHRTGPSPDRYAVPPCPWYLDASKEAWSIQSLDGGPAGFAVTMNLDILTRPDDILGATRRAVAHDRGRPKPRTYQVPIVPSRTELCDRVRGLNLPPVNLPHDERLEQTARDWTKSANPFVRREGAIALRSFRSDENLAILNDLLWDHQVEGGRTLVRETATNVLKRWGVEVAGPGEW